MGDLNYYYLKFQYYHIITIKRPHREPRHPLWESLSQRLRNLIWEALPYVRYIFAGIWVVNTNPETKKLTYYLGENLYWMRRKGMKPYIIHPHFYATVLCLCNDIVPRNTFYSRCYCQRLSATTFLSNFLLLHIFYISICYQEGQ